MSEYRYKKMLRSKLQEDLEEMYDRINEAHGAEEPVDALKDQYRLLFEVAERNEIKLNRKKLF